MSTSTTVFVPQDWVKDLSDRYEEIISVYLGQSKEKFLGLDHTKDYPKLNEGMKDLQSDL